MITYRYGLKPVLKKNTRIVVLGSMPSERSIEYQQYYGHPRNHFWYIMAEIFQEPFPSMNYQTKLARLTDRGVGLWDVIASCDRRGSADQRITNEQYNPLENLLSYPEKLCALALNGTKATDSLRKWENIHEVLPFERKQLPSTSPVPGKNVKSFAEKTMLWREFFSHYIEVGRTL
ncbi:G/U mismatch-specific uracil-DNA glycosylase [Salisediminibacterium halotolerans]|nr:G/U mismatch-specific uracil-DNA glycosylase [Actinophytocola xinjiangensis]RPE87873.1 G/U mismatch-specific uracil-DNA glycosylase [Salisediminibacterium halotolerans]TWG37930.1 G/U mismatch-specific uracil-DNA glycosylase [Salisediminibacterium halotolerans]GEL08245.1 DNA-deoxyinosine glycosylase [Salisediminibacterium halotolerans]